MGNAGIGRSAISFHFIVCSILHASQMSCGRRSSVTHHWAAATDAAATTTTGDSQRSIAAVSQSVTTVNDVSPARRGETRLAVARTRPIWCADRSGTDGTPQLSQITTFSPCYHYLKVIKP